MTLLEAKTVLHEILIEKEVPALLLEGVPAKKRTRVGTWWF
jgi:hypothetical protein